MHRSQEPTTHWSRRDEESTVPVGTKKMRVQSHILVHKSIRLPPPHRYREFDDFFSMSYEVLQYMQRKRFRKRMLSTAVFP